MLLHVDDADCEDGLAGLQAEDSRGAGPRSTLVDRVTEGLEDSRVARDPFGIDLALLPLNHEELVVTRGSKGEVDRNELVLLAEDRLLKSRGYVDDGAWPSCRR